MTEEMGTRLLQNGFELAVLGWNLLLTEKTYLNISDLGFANYSIPGDSSNTPSETPTTKPAESTTNQEEIATSVTDKFDKTLWDVAETYDGIKIIKYKGNESYIEIPDGVTAIGDYAFSDCSNLYDVTIPNTVTTIGAYAFYGCSSLGYVTIPNSVTSIGDYAFSNCPMINVEIPESITDIGKNIVHSDHYETITTKSVQMAKKVLENNDGIIRVVLLDGISKIEKNGFQDCENLYEIEIPQSVTSIEEYAFKDCKYLTYIKMPESLISIGDYAFSGCMQLGYGPFKIPESVTSIGAQAFYGCSSLTSVPIPESVTSIASNAFNSSALESIYGVAGSYAETYANENGYTFIAQ